MFGPPAAGKTTAARALGLEVFDRDDEQWQGESDFRDALVALRSQDHARAVVIRRGATVADRNRAIRETGATDAFMLATPEAVCIQRASERGRDVRRTVGAIRGWWRDWDRGRDVSLWDGVRPLTLTTSVLAPRPI
jgi:hypothetical protein